MTACSMPLLLVFIAEEPFLGKKGIEKDTGEIPESTYRDDMNLNEFVVLPNSKARSVKLNAR